jgi:hypothetical protein
LITVLIVISIFVGLITIANYTRQETNINLQKEGEKIQIERRNVLNYIIANNLSDSEANFIFINFSKEFTQKIGNDKDIIFISGTQNNITLSGNKLQNTLLKYNVNGTFYELTETGEFQKNLVVSINSTILEIDENPYSFELFDGQNIYYLIKYNSNREVHIIHD